MKSSTNIFRVFSIFLLFHFSFSGLYANTVKDENRPLSKESEKPVDEMISTLETYLNKFFNPTQFNVSGLSITDASGGDKSLTGNVKFLNSDNVAFKGLVNTDSKQIKEISIDFPAGAGFNISDLGRATDNNVRNILPNSISGEAGIFLKSLQLIPATGNQSIQKLTISLVGNAWNMGGMGSMKMENTQIQMIYIPSDTKKITGNIKGDLVMGPARLSLLTELPSDANKLEFSGKYSGSGSSIFDILKGIGGDALVNEMFADMPGAASVFKAISVPDYNFKCIPSSRQVIVNSDGSAGNINILVTGKDKLRGSLKYHPPASFKLASISNELAVIDQMGFTDITLVAGNQVVQFDNIQYESGLNLKGKLNLPEALQKLMGEQSRGLYFTGNMQGASNFSIGTDIDINAVSGDFKFEKIKLSLNKNATEILLKGEGDMVFKVDNQNLRFGLHIGTKPLNAAVEAGINLKMVDGQGELAEWREPFGIPNLTFRALNGTIGVNPTTLIDKFEVGGNIGIGKIPAAGAADTRINGVLDLSLNVTSPASSRISASISELSVNKIIRAFEPNFNASGPLNDLLQASVKDSKVNIDPSKGMIEIVGSVSLFGKNGNISITSSKTSGVIVKGSLDPIVIESGGFTVFAVSGVEGPATKANFDIALTADPQYSIDGALTLMGIQRNTKFIFNKSGFSMGLSGGVLGGALSADMNVSGQNLGMASDLTVEIKLKQEIIDQVRTETVTFIQNQGRESSSKIQAARAECSKAGSNPAEKAFTSAAAGILQGVDVIQGEMATAGAIVADGALSGFNIKSIYFKGSASAIKSTITAQVEYVFLGSSHTMDVEIALNTADAAAMAKTIGEKVGKELLKTFSYLGQQAISVFGELEEFGATFVNTMAPVAKELEKGFNDLAKGFEEIGRIADETWNGRKFEAPANGQPLAEIKPGIRRYDVKVTKISVLQGEDGNNNVAAQAGNAVVGFLGSAVGVNNATVANNYLELWGGVYVKSSGNVFSPPGMNATIWSTNRDQFREMSFADPKGSLSIGGQKLFYAKPADNPYIFIQTDMFEKDDGASAFEDEKIRGTSPAINLGPINGELRGEFTVRDNKSGVDQTILNIEYMVFAHPMMSSQDVRNAIASGDINALNNVLKQGGDLYAADVNALSTAIQANKIDMVNYLMVNGFKPNTSHLTAAVQSTAYNADLVKKLIVRGALPGADVLQVAINKNDFELMGMVFAKGIKANKEQYRAAIAKKDYKMAAYIAKNGGIPDLSDLTAAVNARDIQAVKLAMNMKVIPDINAVNKAVEFNDIPLYNLLITKTKPDAGTLLLASAKTGNDIIFQSLFLAGLKATDNKVITNTIDNGSSSKLKMALQNGGNSNAGLAHALLQNKLEAIVICLDFGADANPAIPYVVKNNNLDLAEKLMRLYSGNGNLLLDESYKSKNIKMAEIALRSGGAQPNAQLKKAADSGDEGFTRLLLGFGADPNLAMEGTIKHKNVKLLSDIIKLGADVKKPEYLVQSAQYKNLEMVKLLVENGADPNPGMKTAVTDNSYEIIKYLLESGASGKGFIAIPAGKGYEQTVKLLLDYGDNPNDGIKPAVIGNFTSTAILLLNYGASPQGLLGYPAGKGNMELTKALVEAGANPNSGIKEGVDANQTPIVKYLLNQGATAKDFVATAANHGNVEMCNDLCTFGDLPQPGMEPAAKGGFVDVAKVLVKFGADAKLRVLLLRAVEEHHADMITYLIQQGNNPNDDGGTGEYFIHMLTGDKRKEHDFNSLKAIVEGGADMNVQDPDGSTPLHLALQNDRKKKETILYLINKGADLTKCDKKGKTVWQKAPLLGDIRNLLKEKNAPKKCGE